jgi:hypothetical protein
MVLWSARDEVDCVDFKNFFAGKATRHLGLAVLLLGLIVLGFQASMLWSSSHARKMFKHLRYGDTLGTVQQVQPGDAPRDAPPQFSEQLKATAEETARLEGQLAEVRSRARFHLQASVLTFVGHYSAIIVSSLAAAVAAIMLVLISKSGWDKANGYLITVFFVMTAASVFFGAAPGLFRQEEGINDNKLLYLKYVQLEDRILTYAATGAHPPLEVGGAEPVSLEGRAGNEPRPGTATGGSGTAGTGAYLTPREFILYVDRELSAGKIPLGMDYSKAPTYTDVFKLQPGE